MKHKVAQIESNPSSASANEKGLWGSSNPYFHVSNGREVLA